jgi:hypothetical protein
VNVFFWCKKGGGQIVQIVIAKGVGANYNTIWMMVKEKKTPPSLFISILSNQG